MVVVPRSERLPLANHLSLSLCKNHMFMQDSSSRWVHDYDVSVVSTAISDLPRKVNKTVHGSPISVGTHQPRDGFIGRCITGSSIHSLFLHICHALLTYLVLQNFLLRCICTHCYNTLPQAKQSRNAWPCDNPDNHDVISVCNKLTNHQNQGCTDNWIGYQTGCWILALSASISVLAFGKVTKCIAVNKFLEQKSSQNCKRNGIPYWLQRI